MPEIVNFDHFEILRREDGSLFELGRGAMGITYKAFDTSLRCFVALKVINSTYLNSEVARQRFIREARSAAKLRHRHVATVFHLGDENDHYFYAMEFIDGETVESIIKQQGPLNPALALRITVQVTRALSAAQKHELVHRDIKPANLMLVKEDDELIVKVIDFGLAKSSRHEEGDDASTVSMGGFVGTPHFASPEQLNEKDLDVRSDIYSLGVTLWYMLSGKTPFGGSMAQVMSQQLHRPPPLDHLQNLPEPVQTVLKRMLEKEAENRPQDPAQLRQELEECLGKISSDSAAASSDIEQTDYPTLLEEDVTQEYKPGSVLLDKYEILDDLGDGNYGHAFHARRSHDNREVRIILLDDTLVEEPANLRELEKEVRRLEKLQHPYLINILDLESRDNRYFLVLEWTNGFSLLDLLRTRRELSVPETLQLLGQLSNAVDEAIHEQVQHLDFSLHQALFHFSSESTSDSLLRTPLSQWPEFALKLNPLALQRNLSMSETWAGEQTIVGDLNSRQEEKRDVRYIRSLSSMAYELLGGTLSPLASNVTRYVPLPALSEEGNEILKRGLHQPASFAKATPFFQELARVEKNPARKTEFNKNTISASLPEKQPAQLPYYIKLATGGVILLTLGLGAFFFLKTGQQPAPSVTESQPTPVPTLAPAPMPTREPLASPSPPPAPDRQELLRTALAEAQVFENAGDWEQAIPTYLKIARDFPETNTVQPRLEMALQQLRLRNGDFSDEKATALRPMIEEAAKMNVNSAMLWLGYHLRKLSPTEAFNWLCAAAAQGNAEAMTQVGLMYSNGAGVERDLSKAVEWFQTASDKGDAGGKFCLAECYLNGKGVTKDQSRAIASLQEAVAAGDPRAMNLLGNCYHKGIGVEKNFGEAFKLFTMAKDLKHWDALGNLGVLYINGDGVSQNLKEAVKLFKEGSENGSASCMYFYARCLENGFGSEVTPNPVQAREWYKKAAEGGNSQALQWCNQNGVSVSLK